MEWRKSGHDREQVVTLSVLPWLTDTALPAGRSRERYLIQMGDFSVGELRSSLLKRKVFERKQVLRRFLRELETHFESA